MADAERIKVVAQRVARAQAAGNQVVVVISAMADTTDHLLKLAYEVAPEPDQRELDMLLATGEIVSATLLSMALKALGLPAVSLSGAQAGIWTDAKHSQARILVVESHRINKELLRKNIVVVAGFQGVSREMEVTTLGRGGSDTTAVALAAGLKAERCEIYTDVEGVFTADPHLLPQARKLEEISYEEMLEMAWSGAKVMHPRSVELGLLYKVPILVASSFNDSPGTLIHGGVDMEIRNKVRGIAHDLDVAKVTVVAVPDRPGIAASIFETLAGAGISVDTIVQNVSLHGVTDLSFTVARHDLARALKVLGPVIKEVGAKDCIGDAKLAKVSIIGSGMQNTPGYAARMFRTLAGAGINIELITTSEIRITCLVNEGQLEEAITALHRAFELEKAD